MKRIIMMVVVAVAACEGEPPKVPVGAAPVAVPEPTMATSAPAIESAAPANLASPCVESGDAAAPVSDASAAAPAVVAAKATLTGIVTTTPAASAANAVIYLEDAPIEPTAKMSATVDNRQMNFSPFVAVIPVGGHVVFHNSDPFPHNVFSPDNDRFNIGVIAQGAATSHTFKTPGKYTLLCNLHPGMVGYIIVSPSSYFAKTDAKGHYTIKEVPAGTYKVTAWAPRQQPITQSSKVDGDVSLDFQLHR
jgi:plastocyanin